MQRFTFPKSEHLISKNDIETLFSSGSRAYTVFPVRAIFYKVNDCKFPSQVLISISKRHFPHAVDRNKAKRQIREAYRLNKFILWDILKERQEKLHIAFIWLSDNPQPTKKVASAILKLLQIMSERL